MVFHDLQRRLYALSASYRQTIKDELLPPELGMSQIRFLSKVPCTCICIVTKVQQKISGCFRRKVSAQQFHSLRTYLLGISRFAAKTSAKEFDKYRGKTRIHAESAVMIQV